MTRPLRLLLPFALFLASAATDALAQDASTLEERMSFKDFTRFGLDKLSPDQLRGLNEWMKAHGLTCPPAVSAGTATAPVVAATTSATTTSRLVGNFTGWEKGTVLTLENGQHWEVRDDEPFTTSREPGPEVTVEKALLGWRLSVAGHAEVAHVIPAGH